VWYGVFQFLIKGYTSLSRTPINATRRVFQFLIKGYPCAEKSTQ